MVTVAHIQDSKAVVWLMLILQDSFASIQTVLADGGYQGDIIETVKLKFGYYLKVVMQKDSNKTSFKPIHKR